MKKNGTHNGVKLSQEWNQKWNPNGAQNGDQNEAKRSLNGAQNGARNRAQKGAELIPKGCFLFNSIVDCSTILLTILSTIDKIVEQYCRLLNNRQNC